MKNIGLIIFILGTFLLVACSSSDSSSDSSSEDTDTTELEGTWTIACYGPDENGRYHTDTYVFSGKTFQYEQKQYSESTCSDSAEYRLLVSLNGNFTIGSETTSTTDEAVKEIDISSATMTFTAKNDDLTVIANSISLCGFTDWEKDVAKDVAGSSCASNLSSDKTYYDIYKLDGTSLTFGKASDFANDSSDTRQTELDTVSYAKQ